MTTLQKTLVTATVTVLAGAGIYEARQAAQLREQNQSLQRRQVEQIQKLQRERDDATNRLADLLAENSLLKANPHENELLKLRSEVTRLQTAENDPAASAAKALYLKVNKLKQRLAATPEAQIPELKFVTEQDWLDVASKKLETDTDYRRALAELRSKVEDKFGHMYMEAARKFADANNSVALTDLAQLQPYFDQPVDETILQRWQVESAKQEHAVMLSGDWVIVEKAAVDDTFDTRHVFGTEGYGTSSFLDFQIGQTLSPLYKAYSAANNGKQPENPSLLQPYCTSPEQQAALQKMILRTAANQ